VNWLSARCLQHPYSRATAVKQQADSFVMRRFLAVGAAATRNMDDEAIGILRQAARMIPVYWCRGAKHETITIYLRFLTD
jgi:hypothetical protein